MALRKIYTFNSLAKLLFLIALTITATPVLGQSLPASAPPPDQYCPSNTPGQCFKSFKAAENAMRAAEPNGGQFLKLKDQSPEQLPSTVRYNYSVPDQVLDSYGASLYGIDYGGVIGGDGYCPVSLATEDRPTEWGGSFCYDEAEMISTFAAKPKGCGGRSCYTHDYVVEGSYILPYSEVSAHQYTRWVPPITVNGPNEGWLEHVGKEITWQETYNDGDHETYSFSARLLKIQRFVCPAGLTPIATDDTSINPKLCRSPALANISVARSQVCSDCVGHPSIPATGDKYRAEVDFNFAGRAFTRYYHSLRQLAPEVGRLGAGWTHTFSAWMGQPNYLPKMMTDEGHLVPYLLVGIGHLVISRPPTAAASTIDQQSDGSWRTVEPNGRVSVFASTGQLLSMEDPDNAANNVVMTYDTRARLSKVTDATGRFLQFVYDTSDYLIGVQLPDGQLVSYNYDANQNLASVDYGNGQVKQYLYGETALAPNGDAGLLTGIVSEDGQRYGSFGYDEYGRVVSSVLHDGSGTTESTEVTYPDATHAAVRTMTGEVRNYTFGADRQVRSIASGSVVETTVFDTYGYGRVASHTDRRGVETQFYYNGDFQRAEVVEAANDSSGAKRTLQTDWDQASRRPSEVRRLNASDGLVAKTNWTYNARGQVLTNTRTDPLSSSTRTSSAVYCEPSDVTANSCPVVGLLRSTDGARTDATDNTTFAYYASDDATCASSPTTCPHRKGDLWKATNALGHITETMAYDGTGRPIKVKDPNGVITEMTYH
ncbi:MAG: RHS repeat protein, partial [Alphaproteobacteria bacterium]